MKRILIIRPSAIGDVVMASPLISALRRAYPAAYLAWLVEPYAYDLLRHNRLLDAVILWPKGYWKQLIRERNLRGLAREIQGFAVQLRQEHFDIVLDGQGLLRSRLLARLTNAPQRIGLDSREPGKSLMTRIVPRGNNTARISSEYLELAMALGLPLDDFRMGVAVGEEDLHIAQNLLSTYGVSKPYVLLCPFTTRPQKHWIEERWLRLAAVLTAQLDLSVVILGGAGDTLATLHTESQPQVPLYDFTGKTSLGVSAALVKLAHLVVGVDTGLTHLAIALDRPTITLFGSTCPYTDTATTNTEVLYHRQPCSPCHRRPSCQGAYHCMRAITVEQVTAAAQNLLGKSSGRL